MGLEWVKMFSELPEHPKIKKLERAVGIRAFDYTARAILWLSRFRPDGDTRGMELEIEEAVRFDGQPGSLIAAWRDKNWIDENGFWHDWDEIQTAHKERHDARKRQRAARVAAKADTAEKEEKRRAERQLSMPIDVSQNVTVTKRDMPNNTVFDDRTAVTTTRKSHVSQNVTVTSERMEVQGVESANVRSEAMSRSVTVTSESESLSLEGSFALGGGPGEGGQETRALPAIREVGNLNVGQVLAAVNARVRPQRSRTIVGLVEADDRAKTPDEYLKRPQGESMRQRFPALDGRNGRLTMLELLTEMWPRYLEKCEVNGDQQADVALLRWISSDYGKYERGWNLDRQYRPGDVAPAAQKKKPGAKEVHAVCTRLQERDRSTVDRDVKDSIELPPPLEEREAWLSWYARHRDTVVKRAIDLIQNDLVQTEVGK